jgi:hypothetical protein
MTPEQIRKALKADIITQEQADVMLAGKAASEAPADSAAVIGQEDNMRFLRSFSDVFIGLGLIILMLGVSALAALTGGGGFYLGAAAIVFLMANYFGHTKRAHFPTLILALTFLIFVQRGAGAVLGGSGTLAALITVGAMGLFYWRIRLPFCVALIALALLYLLFSVLGSVAPDLTKTNLGWVLFAAGVAVFGAAVAYDTRDTHRLTRFADNAFWLHFIAAPMIIHGLAISTITAKADTLFGFVPMVSIGRGDAGILLVIIAIITLIGLAINSRALIVSSLGYAGFALAYLFDGTGLSLSMSVTIALVTLGAMVVFLGTGWHFARNQIIRILPDWKMFPPPFIEQKKP